MKFLIDMNLSPKWCEYLIRAGHEAVHWIDFGAEDAPDVELMRWAAANDHVVITNDLDFSALLAASGDSHPSVVQLRSDSLQPDRVGPQVIKAIELAEAELEAGAVLTIDATQARMRVLPLTTRS